MGSQPAGEVAITSGFGDVGQPSPKKRIYIIVHGGAFNIMESEHFCDGSKGLKSKPRTDPRFWSAGDKELDLADLAYEAGEHRDSRPISGFAFKTRSNCFQNGRY